MDSYRLALKAVEPMCFVIHSAEICVEAKFVSASGTSTSTTIQPLNDFRKGCERVAQVDIARPGSVQTVNFRGLTDSSHRRPAKRLPDQREHP